MEMVTFAVNQLRSKKMKIVAISSLLAIAFLSFTLTACGGSNYGSGENMIEKMAIFSLIALTVFSIFVVSFGGSRQKNNGSSGKVDLIQHGSTYPLSTSEPLSVIRSTSGITDLHYTKSFFILMVFC